MLSNFRLTFGSSVWFYVLLAIAAVALAVVVYRYTLPPVAAVRRTVLWLLRSLALILILLMLFEPVLSFFRSERQRPTVALLVDKSASMDVSALGDNRLATTNALLRSPELKHLAERVQLRTFSFADTATECPFDSLQRLPAAGVGTDLAGAWRTARKALAAENLVGMIMLTDGSYNLGASPEREASSAAIPIHTIGLGDTSSRNDAVIADILTNELTYLHSRVPVDLRVRAKGLKSRSARLRLLGPQGAPLGEENLRFTEDQTELTVSMEFEAASVGDLRVTAVLDSVPGEVTADNNRRSVIITVLENKSRVVILSGPPAPDLTMLRQSLEMDSTIELTAFVEAGQGKFIDRNDAPTASELEAAKLIILANFPTRFTSESTLNTLLRAATDQRIPVLFLAGGQVASGRLAQLRELLPFELTKQLPSAERVTLRESGTHPALASKNPLPAEWSALPPAFGGNGNYRVDAGVQVVARLSRAALGIPEDEPAVAYWCFPGRRGAAIFCWGTQRWRLQLASGGNAATFYDELMSRTVKWLIAPAEERRVIIKTAKKLYSGGERARFIAQVYGSDLQPRDDATIDLTATSGDRAERVPMRSRGNGRYEGDLVPWAEGEYRFSGRALAGTDTLGSDGGIFGVEAFNIELVDPRARFDILTRVAELSNGSFAPASGAAALLNAIQPESRVVTSKREIPLWNKSTMLWIVIALLAAEWMLRKRSGML
ncbi:VWA domain-containing protein [candidate division KSB1 bacterium]|nr:VWA domain-containing protein [candidate division KSB1 bacterium]